MHSPSTNPPFDEFEVNLEASQSHLKHQFQCFLAKSRANSFRCGFKKYF